MSLVHTRSQPVAWLASQSSRMHRILHGVPSLTHAALSRQLKSKAAVMDGEEGLSRAEERLLDMALLEADEGVPGRFTEREARYADELLDYYAGTVGDDISSSDVADDDVKEAALARATSESFRILTIKNIALIEKLEKASMAAWPDGRYRAAFTVDRDRDGHLEPVIAFMKAGAKDDPKQRMHTIPLQYVAMILAGTEEEALRGEATNPSSNFRTSFAVHDGALYVNVYRILPGDRLFFRNRIRVPDRNLAIFFQAFDAKILTK